MSGTFSTGQKAGIFMFMLGTIPILATSTLTTVLLIDIHGDAGQPAPVVVDVLAGAVVLATGGAILYSIFLVNWGRVRHTAVGVWERD